MSPLSYQRASAPVVITCPAKGPSEIMPHLPALCSDIMTRDLTILQDYDTCFTQFSTTIAKINVRVRRHARQEHVFVLRTNITPPHMKRDISITSIRSNCSRYVPITTSILPYMMTKTMYYQIPILHDGTNWFDYLSNTTELRLIH